MCRSYLAFSKKNWCHFRKSGGGGWGKIALCNVPRGWGVGNGNLRGQQLGVCGFVTENYPKSMNRWSYICPHRAYMQTYTFSLNHFMALLINFCNSYAKPFLTIIWQRVMFKPRDKCALNSVPNRISKAESGTRLMLQRQESQSELSTWNWSGRWTLAIDLCSWCFSEAAAQNIRCERRGYLVNSNVDDKLVTLSWFASLAEFNIRKLYCSLPG